MCRSIKKLRFPDRTPTSAELESAALQYVRKVSGFRKPSHANEKAFDDAIAQIADATRRLLDELVVRGESVI